MTASKYASWFSILRMGLVQTALGAIVVLTTSTLNRVMVVELALPAVFAGGLVGVHHVVQLLRPKFGYDSDMGAHRTPWIVGGVAVLGLGAVLASFSVSIMENSTALGVSLGTLAFVMIGAGAGASGTSLLAMMATIVAPKRRAAAGSMVWIMMIFGFIVTTKLAGDALDPFTMSTLMTVTAVVSAAAFALAVVAVWGLEAKFASARQSPAEASEARSSFREVFAEIWTEPAARAFTVFVFMSMLAYSTQDLILEPFAGAVHGFTPGESTKLTSEQYSGVLVGMLLVAFLAGRLGTIRVWTVAGCVVSGLALGLIAASGIGWTLTTSDTSWSLVQMVQLLGLGNGVFAAGAIGWMMTLASEGKGQREGVRMGLWGGAQAMAVAIGAFLGTVGFDVTRWIHGSPSFSYALVFAVEGALFIVAAALALNMRAHAPVTTQPKWPLGATGDPT